MGCKDDAMQSNRKILDKYCPQVFYSVMKQGCEDEDLTGEFMKAAWSRG